MLLVSIVLLLSLQGICCQNQCTQDCSTTSQYSNNKYHDISCSIQTTSCSSNANSDPPAAPLLRSNGKHWHLLPDPDMPGYKRIAFNFSWGQDDSSVESLQGYKISLSADGLSESIYFCINQNLDALKDIEATYYFNCFGTKKSELMVPYLSNEKEILAQIRSLPRPPSPVNDQKLSFYIIIPSCEDPELRHVFECAQLNKFSVSIKNISCDNRSIEGFYNMPPILGNRIKALYRSNDKTAKGKKIKKLEGPTGRFNFTLSEKENIQDTYILLMWSIKPPYVSKSIPFNFSECINVSKPIPSNLNACCHSKSPDALNIILPSIFAFVIVVFTVAGIYFHWGGKFVTHRCLKDKQPPTIIRNDRTECLQRQLTYDQVENVQTLEKSVSVCIIFLDDHVKHRKVVLDFANYLHGDLHFNVICELYETELISADPLTWMEKGLNECDKIIVIWSPGAVKKWNMYNNVETAQQDIMFTPMLKRIKKDIFRDQNVGKYYFAYFDYCTKDDIPDIFRETSVFHFKLMEQFEELYFRLQGIEMYMPGAVIRKEEIAFDRYFDPNVTTYGPSLETSICEMCAYVKENPDWHLPQGYFSCPTFNLLNFSLADDPVPVEVCAMPPVHEMSHHATSCETSNSMQAILLTEVPQSTLASARDSEKGPSNSHITCTQLTELENLHVKSNQNTPFGDEDFYFECALSGIESCKNLDDKVASIQG